MAQQSSLENSRATIAPNDWWRGRRVFVTGCAGLLGSHLCATLIAHGAEVVGLIRDRVPHSLLFSSGASEQMTLASGDLRDQSLLERVLNGYEIQTVFHLAAQAIVGAANRNPIETFDSNIRGTWTLLEAARRTRGIGQVIVASSDKAYGAHERLPYDETMPLQGRHPYDVSKSCADLIAQAYGHTYELPVAITRCGNLFGEGDLNWNRIVPGTLRSILENAPPLVRSDGTMTRDYLYVQDGVNAYLHLARKLADDASLAGHAFNFGHNAPLSVLELVQKMLQVAEREDLQPVVLNEANNEIAHQYLDSTRARQQLGWQPEYSIEDGLRRTLDWYRAYFERANRASSSNA
jgi:CDP-glucose 4,6-dehydratase